MSLTGKDRGNTKPGELLPVEKLLLWEGRNWSPEDADESSSEDSDDEQQGDSLPTKVLKTIIQRGKIKKRSAAVSKSVAVARKITRWSSSLNMPADLLLAQFKVDELYGPNRKFSGKEVKPYVPPIVESELTDYPPNVTISNEWNELGQALNKYKEEQAREGGPQYTFK